MKPRSCACLLYTSDAADDMQCVDLGGGGGQRIDLRLAEVLASQEHVLILSHGSFL